MDNPLVKVIYMGNASPGDGTGKITLVAGPNGEYRTLTMGGDPSDALVTGDELHMLTSQFQIEVCEEQPELTEEDIEAQTPSTQVAGEAVEVTLPADGEPAEDDPEAHAGIPEPEEVPVDAPAPEAPEEQPVMGPPDPPAAPDPITIPSPEPASPLSSPAEEASPPSAPQVPPTAPDAPEAPPTPTPGQ